MKQLFTLAGLFIATLFMAQAPDLMSYQAIVRNSANNLMTNTSVGMKLSVLKGSTSGTVVYSETQNPNTNSNGLLTVQIGNGTVLSGTLSSIDWGADKYFIKTETDPNGATTYTITGISQLLSVPYALYAKNSGSSLPGPQGPKGDTGATGAKGDTGTAGANGAQGPKGDTGATGAKGDTGAAGTNGSQGPKGDTGTGFSNGTGSAQVYLTSSSSPYAPQNPVSLNGDATIANSGALTIANNAVTTAKINDGAVTIAKLSATGTKDSTTFLRGDGTWAAPAAGSGSGTIGLGKLVDKNNQVLGYIQTLNMNNYVIKTTNGYYMTVNLEGVPIGMQAYYSDSSCNGNTKYVNAGNNATGITRNGKFLYYEVSTGKFFQLQNINTNGYTSSISISGSYYLYNINSNSFVATCGTTANAVTTSVWPIETTEITKATIGFPTSITLPLSVQ